MSTRAATKRGGGARKVSRTRGRRSSRGHRWLTRIFAALPFEEAQLIRAGTWIVLLLAFLVLWGVARASGLPDLVDERFSRLAASAGFKVNRVEVTGVDRLDKAKVYAIVLSETDRAMPAVDLQRIRQDLLSYGWVGDARVSRRLPDTLLVDITERVPAAVWSRDGKLSLIDADGVVLERVSAARKPKLPTIVGKDANVRTRELAALLDAAPALKPRIAAASWIGNRRWDLQFTSGETLALPEGKQAAAVALTDFARMDGVSGLLGKNITRFDMRDPDRAYFRLDHPVAQTRAKDDSAG